MSRAGARHERPPQDRPSPKSPFWYIRGTVRHIRVEESTGIVDDGRAVNKKIAEEIRAEREAEIIELIRRRAKAGKSRTLQDRVASKFASFSNATSSLLAICIGIIRRAATSSMSASRSRSVSGPTHISPRLPGRISFA
jgi:hypothetical protein